MTVRLFYAVTCDDEFVLHIPREQSSDYTESVILNIAPCSATFVNDFLEVIILHDTCEKLHPTKTFKIKAFNY